MSSDEPKIRPIILFQVARADAINAYSGLEQAMQHLFADLLGTPLHRASFVFTEIVNARSRNEIISELIREHFEDSETFNKSLTKRISATDMIRNRIVHWIIMVSSSSIPLTRPPDPELDKLHLSHPDLSRHVAGKLDYYDLLDFTARASYLSSIVRNFSTAMLDEQLQSLPEEQRPPPLAMPLQDIFPLQVDYPPASDHPL